MNAALAALVAVGLGGLLGFHPVIVFGGMTGMLILRGAWAAVMED